MSRAAWISFIMNHHRYGFVAKNQRKVFMMFSENNPHEQEASQESRPVEPGPTASHRESIPGHGLVSILSPPHMFRTTCQIDAQTLR